MKKYAWFLVVFTMALSLASAEASPVTISNPGFEIDETIGDGLPTAFADWSGDLATIVSAENGIVPLEGTRMLRFDATFQSGPGGISSDVWQLVDMTPWAADIASGLAVASWSAAFNRVEGNSESEPQFAVSIRAFSGLPTQFPSAADSPLASSVTFLLSDADPGSWQAISTDLLLPVSTSYIGVLVAARETLSNSTSNEFDGHYVDQGQLMVTTPEPATLSLVALGLAAAARAGRQRRRLGQVGVSVR